MACRKVSVVITDLDNTLFDWFDTWQRSFTAMLEVIVDKSGIPKDDLLPEIKAIHQHYGTSEYAFLIQKIPSLRSKHPGKDLVELLQRGNRCFSDRTQGNIAALSGR